LKSAIAASRAAEADLAASKGAFTPQIYAIAMADGSSMTNSGNHAGYTVGLSASLPLYDAGERRDAVNGMQAKLDEARDRTGLVQQLVEKDTASAWFTMLSANALAKSASDEVTAAQQSYSLANMRYNAGKAIVAERLDALTALVRAQESLSAAKMSQIIARAKLMLAIGQ
jgi:outer membrane protein TolC